MVSNVLVIGEGDGEGEEEKEKMDGNTEQDSVQPVSNDSLENKSPNR